MRDRMSTKTTPKATATDNLKSAAAELGRRGGLKGGSARAASMTAEERSVAAKIAAQARWSKKPAAIATHVGSFRIGDKEIECAVLENGTRVITQRAMLRALDRTPAGADDEAPAFLRAENIKSFISDDLRSMMKPLVFRHPQGGTAHGFPAEILPKVCQTLVQAKAEGKLHYTQERSAAAAQILLSALQNVAIIALVDEATGYQYQRARNELEQILEAFIAEQLRPWIKTFPDSFYRELYRLMGWPAYSTSAGRPGVVGTMTNDLIYARLAPGVLDELQRLNPVTETGRRKTHHHRWLTEHIGHPKLQAHLDVVVSIMKLFDDGAYKKFHRALDRAKPNLSGPLLALIQQNES